MLKRTDYLTRVYGKPQGWSLATYERENQQVYQDAEFMKLIRGLAQITYPQSSRSELLEDAPTTIS